MQNKALLILLVSLIFISNAYSDTIYCCNSDTLTLWYYYQGVLHNDECDIKMDDTLYIGLANSVFVEIEVASSIPDFILKNKKNDLCEWETLVLENNIFEITNDGKFSGEIDNGTAGPPVTNFHVIKGEASEINNPYILPQSIQSPSYEVKIRNDFESYQWSNGEESNSIFVDQPGDYTVEATTFCGEILENTFVFDEDAFSAQQFFAGKIAGENVEYIDFDPDSSSHIVDGGEKHFDFDINNNGLTDMTIDVSYVNAMSHVGAWLTVSPQNGCEIAVDGNDKIAARIEPGQMINKFNSYSQSSPINLAIWYSSQISSCSSGLWGTDNYLGFSIPTPIDTLYGWMEIEYSLSGASDLIIDGYAYITDYPVNINKIQQDQILLYPNPFVERLQITTQLQHYTTTILDVFGKTVIMEKKMSGNSDVNLESLPSGIYFMVFKSDNIHKVEKVVKQ